jgi:hypothetical protein
MTNFFISHLIYKKLFEMRSSTINAHLTTLWHRPTTWLAGLNVNILVNTKECFRLTDFWARNHGHEEMRTQFSSRRPGAPRFRCKDNIQMDLKETAGICELYSCVLRIGRGLKGGDQYKTHCTYWEYTVFQIVAIHATTEVSHSRDHNVAKR